MIPSNISLSNVLGVTNREPFNQAYSVANIASHHLPGMSAAVGVARIIFSLIAVIQTRHMNSNQKLYIAGQIGRGCLEISQTALPYLLYADIAFTVLRLGDPFIDQQFRFA